MTKTTAIIVDDEPRARTLLQKYINTYCPMIEIIGMAENAKSAFTIIDKQRPELLFLDVEISTADSPNSSFDLLALLPKYSYEVIFVTAFNQYALQAIKFHALAYLLKPINISELEQAVKLARKRLGLQQQNLQLQDLIKRLDQPEKAKHRIWIPSTEGLQAVFIPDIVRLEAAGRCTFLFNTKGERLFSSRNLKEYILMLADYPFFHVHRSHVVNTDHILKYIAREGGAILMSDEKSVPISRRKKQAFLRALKDL